MCTVISHANIKGGVGKSTGNCTMAVVLAKCGYKVLIIDNDPQGNASYLFGMMQTGEEHFTVRDLYMCPESKLQEQVPKMVYHTPYKNIDIIVSEPAHKDTIVYASQVTDRDPRMILANAIRPLRESYDFIIIDKNPSEDILATNVLAACDEILAPVEMDGFSYQGLGNLFMGIEQIQSYTALNPNLKFRGIYMVKTVRRSNVFKNVYEAYQRELGDMFFMSNIRSSLIVYECTHQCRPLLHIKKRTAPGEDYILLMHEIGYISEQQALDLLKEHAVSPEYR